MTPGESATRLQAAITEGTDLFERAYDGRTTVRPRPGAWCAREILGHLIDSACNNHRRFIVGQSAETKRFDGYDGDAWVARQRYDMVPWRDLVTLWSAYNRHLVHVMTCTTDEAGSRSAVGPEGDGEVTIAFLMEDYVTHLQHHVDDIRQLLTS